MEIICKLILRAAHSKVTDMIKVNPTPNMFVETNYAGYKVSTATHKLRTFDLCLKGTPYWMLISKRVGSVSLTFGTAAPTVHPVAKWVPGIYTMMASWLFTPGV